MKLSSIDVSIIMPVYNAEKYISESIRSVQNQNFDNWEIICIDDGSTDNSVNIVKKISLTDNRVKLLFQNHAGSGPARNKGIINAQGRYVCFLDADDIRKSRGLSSCFSFLYTRQIKGFCHGLKRC